MVIDWVSFGIGAVSVFAVFMILILLKLFREPKYDLHNFKKLTRDAGLKIHEAYQNIKQLDNAFKEIENGR